MSGSTGFSLQWGRLAACAGLAGPLVAQASACVRET
jgi:hypothetical protein